MVVALTLTSRSQGAQPAGSSPTSKTNIVIILADDLGSHDLGCYGNQFNETPNLDRLAKSGMKFTAAYAACPVCSPTRASLMTGKHPARLQLTNFLKGTRKVDDSPVLPADYRDFLPLEEVTLAEELKRAGYDTAAIGKWHLGDKDHGPDKQGFDFCMANGGVKGYFNPNKLVPPLPNVKSDDYLTDRLTNEACQFIARQKDKPFFLYLAHYAPHIPLQPKPALLAKYEQKLKTHPTREAGVYNPHYAAMIESLDTGVGRVLDELEKQKLTDKTAVLFLSDNGGLSAKEGDHTPATSNAPCRGGKGDLYEGGVRIPLLVRWPGLTKPDSTSAETVSTLDVLPTVCELVGQQPEPDAGSGPIDGRSFAAALKASAEPLPARPLFWHYPHFANQGGHPAGAVRDGDWKLIESYETGDYELFNLRQDPEEKNNLAAKEPQRALALRQQLARWRGTLRTNMPKRNAKYDKKFWPPFGVADFVLVNEQGKQVTKADYLGKPWICCFVFTRCRFTCPRVFSQMQMLQKECDKAGVRMVAFSVDPKNDTPASLKLKAKELGAKPERWSFLTAGPKTLVQDKAAIYRLIENSFRMPVRQTNEDDQHPDFDVIHSNNIIYVDADGHPRAKFNAMNDAEMVKLRRVISGQEPPVEPPVEKPDGAVVVGDGGAVVFANPPDKIPSDAAEEEPVAESASKPELPGWVKKLPTVNASLNGLATLLLIAGGVLIKRRQYLAHKQVMLTAFAVSVLFLASYLVYHSFNYTKSFTGPGWAKAVYLAILISHIILAITVPILAILTIRRGLKAERLSTLALSQDDPQATVMESTAAWARHRGLARITYPIWLYVSVTGVIIYLMLYHWPAGT